MNRRHAIKLGGAAVLLSGIARAQNKLKPENIAGGFVEPPRIMRAKGWKWDHEVRVYLPPGYKTSDKTYPTLWVTDNSLEVIQGALSGAGAGLGSGPPELIVVAVGAPAGTNYGEFGRRRAYDFIPDRSLMGELFANVPPESVGGAAGFLDFLVNQLRPQLAREYRMNPKDHGYAGHSGGAQFGLYVLFNQPQSFSKYISSSPVVYQPWLDMEEKYFSQHKDLPAKVFLSAGEAELVNSRGSQIVSTVALVSARLIGRKYPSLELFARIFPGEDHLSVMPIAYAKGIRALWG